MREPVLLDHAGAWRVYLGGSRIRALRGDTAPMDDHFPEEWIASVVEAAGLGASPGDGLSRLRETPFSTLRSDFSAAIRRNSISLSVIFISIFHLIK